MRFHSFSIPWDDMMMDHCIIAWVGNWWILMDRMEIFLPKKMHKEMLKMFEYVRMLTARRMHKLCVS